MKASKVLSVTLARFIDIVSIVVIGWLLIPSVVTTNLLNIYGWSMFVAVLASTLVFPAFGVYSSWRSMRLLRLLRQVLYAWTSVVLIVATLFFLFKVGEQVSRYWLLVWWFVTLLTMWSARASIYALLGYMRKTGANHKHVMLLGDALACERVTAQVKSRPQAGYEITQCMSLTELETLGKGLVGYDELWLLLPLSQASHIESILQLLNQCTVNVRWLPDDSALLSVWQSPKDLLGMTALDLRVSPMSEPANLLLKAIEDRVLALAILLLISPVMLLLALGVKLTSKGPVFYRQERVGLNGELFNMLKFRSMPVDVEKDGVQWGSAGSKTNTWFGAFIRKTSLDELPQFINVLKGDMSIVGPRPERPMFVEQFKDEIPGYMQKHMVKAGITGWAQVHGWRGDTCLKTRIEFDLWYIEHWSLWLDIKIIIMTLFKGFVHSNAR